MTKQETKDKSNNEVDEGESGEVDQKEKIDSETIAILNELPEVPTDAGGINEQLEGPFATNNPSWEDREIEEIRERLNKLPPLPKDANEDLVDQYFKYFYG